MTPGILPRWAEPVAPRRGTLGRVTGINPQFDEICPPLDGDGLEPVHERSYIVRAYRQGADRLLLRGAVRDDKPAGLYVADDPDPLTIHHMIVDLVVAMPSMEITAADVVMDVHPTTSCPTISEHYRHLIGLSVVRGYTHRVRELFGGPRGCSHTTALLQAMGPVAVQSIWSFRVVAARERGEPGRPQATEDDRRRSVAANLNTCHVWREDGQHVADVLAGTSTAIPLPIVRRLHDLGRPEREWAPD